MSKKEISVQGSYKISVKEWVEKTNAIGLRATGGHSTTGTAGTTQ